MTYRPDPGGVLRSDAHRVTLGHLPAPDDEVSYTVGALHGRLAHPQLSPADVALLLTELEEDGLASEQDGLWWQSEAGHEAMSAPVPYDESATPEPVTVTPGVPQIHEQPRVTARSPSSPSPRPRSQP